MHSLSVFQPASPKDGTGAVARVPLSFSGHETFPFRYTWLAKGVRGVAEAPDLFAREDSLVVLGVGKNMVRAIRHWCETLHLVERGEPGTLRPSTLGTALFGPSGWDPCLEDVGTLWLLHWLLTARPEKASTWHFALSLWNADQFRRDDLADWLFRTSQAAGSRATPASIRRDVEVFIRSYVPARNRRDVPSEDTFDCPLAELGIIRESEPGVYHFVRGAKRSLPLPIFQFALLDYWRDSAGERQSLSFEKLLYGPGSPGAAFKLAENSLMELLEQLPPAFGLTFNETAGMRVLYGSPDTSEVARLSLLSRYYADSQEG